MTVFCPSCQTKLASDDVSFCPSCSSARPKIGWLTDRHLGTEIVGNQYRVLRRLGAGGFGTVYEVETVVGGLHRALKLLAQEWVGDARVCERFINEAVILEQVSHPNVARCYAAGTLENGELYLLFELIRGMPLDNLLSPVGNARRPLVPARAVRLAKQIASGLIAAHSKGVLHRDLKPQNVLVLNAGTTEEQVKIVDFGIAKVLEDESGVTRNVIGTPRYMAPEQFFPGAPLDARTDLWQLGATLFMSLTGLEPFPSPNGAAGAALDRHGLRGPGPKPSTINRDLENQPMLDAFVSRLLCFEPQHRPASAMDVCEELARIEQTLTRQAGAAAPALLDDLCARRSDTSWRALCRYLGSQDPELCKLAERKLTGWPHELRPAAVHWWEAVRREEFSPLWSLARSLDLSNRGMTDSDVLKLANSRQLAGIRRLNLAGNELGNEAVTALGNTAALSALEYLDLNSNRITSTGIEAIAKSPFFSHLRVLRVAGNGIGIRGMEALANTQMPLRVLDLSDNDLRAAGAEALLQGSAFGCLEVLALRGNLLGPEGSAAIALCPRLTHLRNLDISRNAIGSGGAAALALSTTLSQLRELQIAQNNLGRPGVSLLLRSSRLESLEALNLSSNAIGAAGAMVLVGSPLARRLRNLDLADNELGDAGLATVIGAAHLAAVRSLGLAQNQISESGITLLQEAALQLDSLDLSRNALGDQAAETLGVSVAQLGIKQLNASATGLTATGACSLIRNSGGRLQAIDLSGNPLDESDAEGLWTATDLSELRSLRLGQAKLGAQSVSVIANSSSLNRVELLDLDSNPLGDEGIVALASGSELHELEVLLLRDVGMGPRGAAALATSALATRLSTLDVSFNRFGDAGAEALSQGPGWPRLSDLRVADNELGMGGAAALLTSPGMEFLCAIDLSNNAIQGIVDLHGLTQNQIELLESSFAQAAMQGADFSERFYQELFIRYPTVKPLFAKTTMSRQKQHLMAALTMVIDNLREPDAIEPSLSALGKKHAGYGVFPSHYHALSVTLLDVLRETLGSNWSEAMHEAWSDGIEAISRVMMNAHLQSAVNLFTADTEYMDERSGSIE